jgi:hypothetical protein
MAPRNGTQAAMVHNERAIAGPTSVSTLKPGVEYEPQSCVRHILSSFISYDP